MTLALEFHDQALGYKQEKSITEELPESVPIPVSARANELFLLMKRKIRRGDIRQMMLFYCTYCAYRELHYPVNPDSVGALFGLSSKQIESCASLFSCAKTGYSPNFGKLSALNYLPDYCRLCNLTEEAFLEMVGYYREIEARDPSILEEKPKTVAAGLMLYYLSIAGLELADKNQLVNITGRSPMTLKTMKDRLWKIHNGE